MNQKYYVGVDVSKGKLDIAIIDSNFNLKMEKLILNNPLKIKSFFTSLKHQLKVSESEFLVCAENTGIYNTPLAKTCAGLDIPYWEENALKIKRASTDFRGKSDQKDALRIAEYALRYSDKVVLYKKLDPITEELKALTHIRETLVNQIVRLENQIREAKTHDKELWTILKKQLSPVLKVMKKRQSEIEKLIVEKVSESPDLAVNMGLLKTIPGIGNQISLMFILSTNNFKLFESAKQMACYAGVVPFPNQSGVVNKKDRVSRHANKSLKALLHLAAMAAVKSPGDLKAYYIRKVSEGKNKMSVLNAIRNKLVHRIFSVIKRQTPYQAMMKESINQDSLIFT
ncbi:MAG: IS110 family transposase [Flavobacteriales bacterium]